MKRVGTATALALGVAVAGGAVGAGSGTAAAEDCTKASCQDPKWVLACGAAQECTMLPQPMSHVRGPGYVKLPPTFAIQKNVVTLPSTAPLNVPLKSYPPPSTKWMTAPGAPARKTIDRRMIVARSGLQSDAMREFTTSTMPGLQAVAAQEDSKATLLAKEQAAIKNRHPQWVDDPTKFNYKVGTFMYPVHSCDEYAYKKNFEGAWFREAAAALGSDYRAVYDIATRADSPVRLANKELWTFGKAPMTRQLSALALSYATGNIFADYTGSVPSPPAPTDVASAWATIAKLEAAHRGMPDQEFDDIERRTSRFSDMLEQLWRLQFRHADLLCRANGHKGASMSQTDLTVEFECWDDTGTGGTSGTGSTGSTGGTGGGSSSSGDGKKHPHQKPAPHARATLAQRAAAGKPIATQVRALEKLTTRLDAARAWPALTVTTNKVQGAGAGPAGSVGRAKVDDGPCKNGNLTGLKLQACYVKAEINAVQKDINDAIGAEKALGAKGCLFADPIANHCNFSYHGFAELLAAHFDWKDTAAMCRARIPDWQALESVPKQTALTDKRILYPTQVGLPYTANIVDVDHWFQALDDAPGKWLEHDLARKEYSAKVTGIVAQGAVLPRIDGGFGQASSDGFDVGHPDLFGAGAHYAFSWAIKPMAMGKPAYSKDPCAGIPCGVETRICRFNGSVSGSADATASLFGASVSIMSTSVTAYAEDNAKHGGKGGHLDAHFTLLGNELAPSEVKGGIDTSSTPTYYIARPANDATAAFPDPPLEIGFMVGPIPVTLQAGMTIGAGIDLSSGGDVEDTCALGNGAQPKFGLTGSLSPHIEADAYGQAGVDLAVVDAGVRIDLNLVRLGLPVAFGFNVDGATVSLDTKADVTLGALAGDVGLFAEVRYLVGSDTYDLPIFSWNGISASRPIFEATKTLPTDALSFWLSPPVDYRSKL